ncbi:hypothetical protein AAZX31_06G289800 [Glycine max]
MEFKNHVDQNQRISSTTTCPLSVVTMYSETHWKAKEDVHLYGTKRKVM